MPPRVVHYIAAVAGWKACFFDSLQAQEIATAPDTPRDLLDDGVLVFSEVIAWAVLDAEPAPDGALPLVGVVPEVEASLEGHRFYLATTGGGWGEGFELVGYVPPGGSRTYYLDQAWQAIEGIGGRRNPIRRD